ncbi:Tyrosine recombinase XerD [uncultured archaeon]|nr:Tyrosine recombinase XerD [uncultured archaeon]
MPLYTNYLLLLSMTKEPVTITINNDIEKTTTKNNSEKIKTYFTDMNFEVSQKKRAKIAIEYFIQANPTIDLNTYFIDFRLLHGIDLITRQDQTTIAIKNLITFLENKNLAPNTITGYRTDIKQLHDYYHMTLDETDWKQINKMQKHTGKKFHTTSPTKEQIQRILSNATALEKAYFLTILTTGKRPEEILQIDLEDLHLEEKPPRITFKIEDNTTKKRLPYSFVTEECKDAIQTYLTQRPMFISTITNSHLDIKNKEQFLNSPKLFQINGVTIRRHWNKLLKKANLDENTKREIIDKHSKKISIQRYKFNHYSLRHYFRVYLGNRDLAEKLMGHTDIRNLYNTKQEQEIAKDYIIFSKNLYIYSTQNTDEQMKEDLIKKDEQIQRLITSDEMRKNDMQKLELKLNRLTSLMNRLQIEDINNEPYQYDDQFQMYDPISTNPKLSALDKDKKPLNRKLIGRKSSPKR